jgi:hypothetical protein
MANKLLLIAAFLVCAATAMDFKALRGQIEVRVVAHLSFVAHLS